MADTTAEIAEPVGRSRRPLLLGVLLSVVAGGAVFALLYLGILLPPAGDDDAKADTHTNPFQAAEIAFVPLETLVVSLGPSSEAKHLLVTLQLEVAASYEQDVAFLKPRIADVLNGYLRALEPQTIEAPSSIVRLRGQMLRRVQLVVGDGMVRDLLITEFVLN